MMDSLSAIADQPFSWGPIITTMLAIFIPAMIGLVAWVGKRLFGALDRLSADVGNLKTDVAVIQATSLRIGTKVGAKTADLHNNEE